MHEDIVADLSPPWASATSKLREVYSMELLHDSGSPPTMTISYLDKLNPQQRRAVEHGGSALAEVRPKPW